MLPKTGISSGGSGGADIAAAIYATTIASALKAELGGTHQAVKTIMRWTGAGERTITNWMAGEHGPSGPHLTQLVHHSDAVLDAFLTLSGRDQLMLGVSVRQIRAELLIALDALDRIASPNDLTGR
ncbi:hypothetical protein [Devosia sp. SD17-2]|uniref:hypothetical protein n=1 Tax=Devosia sp. SD17-2 TaxID=2976459 RepID=UPI0023D8898E|nr:hypothetical protein [Devosia sp. SD17-2]WEJ32831.1 hypothetical protein NYQ88_18445 [Devosia sp. SD17-2]